MRTITMTLALALLPAALGAQVAGQASGSAKGSATVAAPKASASANMQLRANAEARAPKDFSADGRARLEAMYAEAREHHLPPAPMARRVAEARAKGASEEKAIVSAFKVKTQLEASQQAMIAGGRARPSEEECERAASAMERGVTRAQVETIARHAPSDRSLVVAFDVLTKLALRGVPVTQALAQVQAKLDARASDSAIASLATSAGANAGAGIRGTAGTVSGAAGGTAAGTATATGRTNAAGAGVGTVTGVTGTVTGTTGIIKKP